MTLNFLQTILLILAIDFIFFLAFILGYNMYRILDFIGRVVNKIVDFFFWTNRNIERFVYGDDYVEGNWTKDLTDEELVNKGKEVDMFKDKDAKVEAMGAMMLTNKKGFQPLDKVIENPEEYFYKENIIKK